MGLLSFLHNQGLMNFDAERVAKIKLTRTQKIMVAKKSFLILLANWLMLYTYRSFAVYGSFCEGKSDQYLLPNYPCSQDEMFSLLPDLSYHVVRNTSCVPSELHSTLVRLNGYEYRQFDNATRHYSFYDIKSDHLFPGSTYGFKIFTNVLITLIFPMFILLFEEYKAYNKLGKKNKTVSKPAYALYSLLNGINYYLTIELAGMGAVSLASAADTACKSVYSSDSGWPEIHTYVFAGAFFLWFAGWMLSFGPCGLSDRARLKAQIDNNMANGGYADPQHQARVFELLRRMNRMQGINLIFALRFYFPLVGLVMLIISGGSLAPFKFPKNFSLKAVSFFDASLLRVASFAVGAFQLLSMFDYDILLEKFKGCCSRSKQELVFSAPSTPDATVEMTATNPLRPGQSRS